MPYRPPTSDDIDHYIHAKYELALSPLFDSVVDDLVASIYAGAACKPRSDKLDGATRAVSYALANLLHAHYRDPNLHVAFPLANASYPEGLSNPHRLGIRRVRESINFLIDANPPYVMKRGGNHVDGSGEGWITRLRPTKRLIAAIETPIKSAKAPDTPTLHKALTGNTFSSEPQSWANWYLFDVAPLPAIRGISSSATIATELDRMGEFLVQYNAFLADHWIDLFIPDDEFATLQGMSNEPDAYFADEDRKIEVDLVFKRQLYRTFNNDNIGHGGRFYGGWWQTIPSDYRKYVTINGGPTAERDYSGMQLNMLYALEGLPPPKKDYELEGFPSEHRKLLKKTFFKMINAKGSMRAPLTSALPEGWTFKMIRQGLAQLHEPIADYLGSGIGIELQRCDADIAENVMRRLMDEEILALPVHDSFLVFDSKSKRLDEVMKEEYSRFMGQQIGVDADPTWIDEYLSDDVRELESLGVEFIDDHVYVEWTKPQYTDYRKRLSDFVNMQDDDWGHRHNWMH